MRIDEFCRVTGLPRDTVRYYEKRGLLTPAIGVNRYREFDAAQVERARVIRTAQALGFTLAEITALGAVYERGGLTRARRARLLRDRVADLDAQAARLQALRAYLVGKAEWLEQGELGAPPALAEC
jgi:DNA-binding transcriptional MerR regulator